MKSRTKIVVYEKPTCSKCRDVKRVLTEKGLEFESVNYVDSAGRSQGFFSCQHTC
jgi:glutaredoxin